MTCCNSKFSTTPLQQYSEYFTCFITTVASNKGSLEGDTFWIRKIFGDLNPAAPNLCHLFLVDQRQIGLGLFDRSFGHPSPTSQAPPLLPVSVFCFPFRHFWKADFGHSYPFLSNFFLVFWFGGTVYLLNIAIIYANHPSHRLPRSSCEALLLQGNELETISHDLA